MSVLLLYAPLQYAPGAVPKPDGSLGIAYLAGALRAAGIPVAVLDAGVGTDPATFERRAPLPSGLVRVGMTDEEIVQAAAPFAVVGVSSTFTAQHAMAEHTVRALRAAYPDKLLLVGGVNARYFAERFLRAGADTVFLSEAERETVEVVDRFRRGSRDFADVAGLALLRDGAVVQTRRPVPAQNLDALPVPAWDLLPNEVYWAIGRPHGGNFGRPVRYAPMMTSRGCPFACTYCHISVERLADSPSGEIASFRVKSLGRVAAELDRLQALGVEYVYVEDDSLLAKKPRAMRIFAEIAGRGLRLADVNGVNIAHLFRNAGAGRLEPDADLLRAMAGAGFQDVSLPFESGSARILRRYASGKWDPARMDGGALIRACVRAGLGVSGNYMIGYPDETLDEVMQTIEMARQHMAEGLGEANVFLVVPFPGTVLFDEALRSGHLPADWSPDEMRWFNPVMRNTTVAPDLLKTIRDVAWRMLNRPVYVGEREQAAVV